MACCTGYNKPQVLPRRKEPHDYKDQTKESNEPNLVLDLE